MITSAYKYPSELRKAFCRLTIDPEHFSDDYLRGNVDISALAFLGGNFVFAATMLGLEYLLINTWFQNAQLLQIITYIYVFCHGIVLTVLAVLLSWNVKGAKNAFTLYLYVWGLLIVFTLATEMLKVISVVPFSFGLTPLCQPRTTDCMVQNYGWIPVPIFNFISAYLQEILAAFSYIYMYVIFRASLHMKAGRFIVVLAVISIIGQFDQIPFIWLEDYLRSIGRF